MREGQGETREKKKKKKKKKKKDEDKDKGGEGIDDDECVDEVRGERLGDESVIACVGMIDGMDERQGKG